MKVHNLKMSFTKITFFSIKLVCFCTFAPGKTVRILNLLKLKKRLGDGRQDYYEDIIIDSEDYFDGTEKILPQNNWQKTGYDPQLLSHGNFYKVEPGSTVKMSCEFTELPGLMKR